MSALSFLGRGVRSATAIAAFCSLSIPAWAAGAFAIVCIALSLFARRSGILLALRRSSFAPGAWKLGVDEDGIWSQGPHGESYTRWSGWRTVEERDGLVLLYHDDVHVQPVPFAAFESAEERRAFLEWRRQHMPASWRRQADDREDAGNGPDAAGPKKP